MLGTVVGMAEARPHIRIPQRFEDRLPAPSDCHAAQDVFGESRGWRLSRSTRPCLRWVAGKRCLAGSSRDCDGCLWETNHRILDHPRLWNTGSGGRVLIAEPYDMGSEWQDKELAKLTDAAARLGLVVEEFPELSVWYPPYTSLLMIHSGDVSPR